MKKSARNRIIIWSLVSVLLIAVLVAGMNLVAAGFTTGSLNGVFHKSITAADSVDITDGGKEFEASEINNLIVGWSNGNVEIKTSQTDKIIVEVKPYNPKSQNDVVHYVNGNGTLGIYSEKSDGWNFFNNFSSKDIVITVPENKQFEEIEVSTASAEASISGVNCNSVEMETASGNIQIANSQGDSVSMNSASGRITVDGCSFNEINSGVVSGETDISGDFRSLDAESVSGEVEVVAFNNCDIIDVETVSGGINITLPKSVNGVDLDYDSVSGKLVSDFSNSTSVDAPSVDLETVSGDMRVTKAK